MMLRRGGETWGGRPLFDDVMPRYHIGGRLSHELTLLCFLLLAILIIYNLPDIIY